MAGPQKTQAQIDEENRRNNQGVQGAPTNNNTPPATATPLTQPTAAPTTATQPTAAPATATQPTAAPTTATQPAPTQPAANPNAPLTREDIQAKFPKYKIGQSVRGPRGVKLDQQETPAGYELVGLSNGFPLYESLKDAYGVDAEAPVPTTGPANLAGGATPSLENVAAQPNFFTDTSPKERVTGERAPTDAEKNQRRDQARADYQAKANAWNESMGLGAPRATQRPGPAGAQPTTSVGAPQATQRTGPVYFKPSTTHQREMEAARQRGLQRAAKQDQAAASLQRARDIAAAMRADGNRPKLATTQDIASYGFDAATQKRLSFGVDERGEPVEVTPQYLIDYAKSKGITKRPATSADRNIPVRGQTSTNRKSSLSRRPFFK